MAAPKAIIVISGKRKSGKDYISDKLLNKFGSDKCAILHLSGPLKLQYAKEHGLDFQRLLDASEYKEKYRADMIRWGEEKRNQDPEFFCRLAASEDDFLKDVWIISDARRLSDVDYFKKYYNKVTITVRVQADLDTRKQRGFVYTEGVDNAESECGLDSGVNWDIVISNNGDKQELEEGIDKLIDLIHF
uniref:Phosphomevalonate kinase n=2 Tax=Arion vulgaris TaxID=1028688 RepID=A0A0B6ZP23_9EUPU